MLVISKHESSGYMHVCDKETSKCGIVNERGEVVVPLEMDYADNVWEFWEQGGFIVFYKEDKVGFLFCSEFKKDVYEEPRFDDWCYYQGELSVKCGDKFYNLNPSTNADLIEVPVTWTSSYKRHIDELRREDEESRIFSLKFEDVILNEQINGFTVVESEGRYNYLNEDGSLLSDKWFEQATNFDSHHHSRVVYKGKEFQLVQGVGFDDDKGFRKEVFVIVDLNDTPYNFLKLSDLDELL